MNKYKISIVNYTNTLPFKYGIMESGLAAKADLQFDIPSVCARKTLDGKVDIGLIPIAVIPDMKEAHIISKYCLGSNDRVETVKLYSGVPLEKVEKVYLDYQSRTSVSLVKVLARFYWKISPAFVDAQEGFEQKIKGNTAAVVIGDRCFDMNGRFAHEYDLAGEWKKFTGMPFVFAAWVSNKKIDEGFVKEFEDALSYGLAHINDAVKENIPPDRQDLILDYLRQRISYDLDEEKQRSMQHFLSLLKQL